MIETRDLTKSFGPALAVDHLCWSVPTGSILGLLGPNGAGKTTTLKLLLGLTHPSSGTAAVFGHDAVRESLAVRRVAAFVPEEKVLYDAMRVDAFLASYGSFFGDWSANQASQLLSRWAVPERARVGELSKGARAKLLLAAALARQPRALFLDEPADGLDPLSLEELLSALAGWVADGGRCAVLATHQLEVVERIGDRVAFLLGGRLAAGGDLDELRASWKAIDVSAAALPPDVALWDGVHAVESRGALSRITTRSNPNGVIERLGALPGAQLEVWDMSLRDIYLGLAGAHGG